jgi:hypothetical protein
MPDRSSANHTNEVHVTPVNDGIEHELTDDCACSPKSLPITRDDGSCGWVVMHHSLDGREAQEHR